MTIAAALLVAGPPTPGINAEAAAAAAQITDPVPMMELLAPGGHGRLYTLSTSEATEAVNLYGFTHQRGQVGYWRTTAFTGSQPVYRLRTGSSYLLTASTAERDNLLAGGRFAYEGIAGHLGQQRASGTQRLMRFSRWGEWRVAFENRSQELVAAGYRIDGPLGWGHPEWIRTGAIYFGTFNPQSTSVMTATKNVFGREGDWWGGVRDFSGADPAVPKNTQGWNEDFSHLQPEIGFYDDSRPETLEKHIEQAAGAGLDFFQFYWYWNTARQNSPKQFEASLAAFAQARNRTAIDFALTVCAHPWGGLQIPTSDYTTVAKRFADTFFNQPNYLRANDGRLVLGLCDRRGLGDGSDADTRSFVDAVRRQARAILNEDVLVLGYWEAMLDTAAPTRWGADGAYCGVRIDHVKSYTDYVAAMPAYFGATPRQFMRCAAAGFDERPRYPHLIPDRTRIRYYQDQTPTLFSQGLNQIRADIANSRHISAVDNFVSIYAWNEWHEGGIIEPNAKDGCLYLGLIHDHLNLQKGTSCTS
ncbi:glycoside hydrolase family 99-like domain-containing protein [Nonomuraea aurantiaca]|uniref:glycoside hydrolase family 99-like domain-containing protein n=1 Tax=Nonomuraea aurantiaca TaxID=2878562 RepID=UPI001CDA3630|nr:glycoside hydrolase family 99-like domain-containing protein [Nonomuraea aurantiaca]MCA2228804.1 glycoside hydrolase family 99-like domain-containing protein [Nonomuraea aurantiaca]